MNKIRQKFKNRRLKKSIRSMGQAARQPENTELWIHPRPISAAIGAASIILIATVASYWGVWQNDFINLDDNEYITDNTQVQAGLSWKGIIWAFTTTHVSNWHPITWLSHMLDCELYGLNPAGHHLTNLLFHIVNALLVFWIFKRMSGHLWRSAFIAGLFALHPLHVESVAWVSERKDVLSTLFWLLTMLGYVNYVQRPRPGRYMLTLLAFGVGLMAKPMLVTLPFVLLILDYWPLGRLQQGNGRRLSIPAGISCLKEKIPFFILSVACCVVTWYAQQSGGAVKGLYMLPLRFRLGNAMVSYAGYIAKMFVPVNLAAYYPHPGDGLSWGQVAGAGLVLALICVLVVLQTRRWPWLTAGWLWYIGTLVPVIGLVQVGAQAMADRYTYVPLIGLFIVVAWGGSELVAGGRHRKALLTVSGAAVLVVLAICTHRQVGYWRNSITLFEHAIAATGQNYQAQFNLAAAYARAGQIDRAIEHNMEAVKLEPLSPEAHHNLAVQLFKKGKVPDAIEHYKQAIRLDPTVADTHNNLAVALEMQGKLDEAMKCYAEAIRLRPDYANAHYGLASVLTKKGNKAEAIRELREVLRIQPGHIRALQELKRLLKNGGD